MTREELEMRKIVRESDVIDKTNGSELAKAFNYLWDKYIEQEPKTGHWMKDKEPWGGRQGWKCNKCNHTYDINVVYSKMPYNYCPNCGAKMESEESDDSRRAY